MSKVTVSVNGKCISIEGDNICIGDGNIFANGIKIGSYDNYDVIIKGNCGSIKSDRSVTVEGSVTGDIDCGGSCHCGNVSGSINAGGSVKANSTSGCGSVNAGGSVHIGRRGD